MASNRRRLQGAMDRHRRAYGRSILQEVRVSELCWVLLVVLLLFQQPILNISGVAAFSYVDEAAVAVIVFAAAAKVMRNSGVAYLSKGERTSCGIGLLLLAWVFVCNYSAGIQTSFVPLAIDALACSKFVIAVVASIIVFDGNRLIRMLEPVYKVTLVMMVPCWLLNTILPGGFSLFGQDMWYEIRYGIRSFEFLFGHPETMSMMVLSMMLVLLRDRSRNSVWVTLCLFFIATSLRSKGFAFVAIAAMLLLTGNRQRGISLIHIALCAAAALLIGWDQFEYYYSTDLGARAEMTRASIAIASDFFPFGSGFATFGSNVTADAEFYSPLYVTYGISNIQGLSLSMGTDFLSDTFWPTVLAQFGLLGLLGYISLLILLLGSLYRRALNNGIGIVAILFIAYLLILSTSGSAFFHPNTICIVLSAVISILSEPNGKASILREGRQTNSSVVEGD